MTASVTDRQAVATASRPPRAGSERPARGYASGKGDYPARLGKIEGQVRWLQKMLEEDRW
jgi:hypothetical protein